MHSSVPNTPKIAIVGGGIGGIALAIGLAAQNVPFHIFESAPSFGEIGAGISFGGNVIRAIQGLSPAMLRAFARHVTANEADELLDAFLTYRKGVLDCPSGEKSEEEDTQRYRKWVPEEIFNLRGRVQQVGGTRFPVRCCVHRAHLLDEWARLLPPGSATFGKTLVQIVEDDERDVVRLTFSDGSTAWASAVVGCDGIKSTTRRHLHGANQGAARYSGFFGYRAMAPRAAFEAALGPDLAATGNLFLCPNGYTIAYPVDHGAALNMFATCLQREGTTWGDPAAWKIPSTEAELRGDLRGWHPGVVDLLVQHGNGEKWAMFHCPHDELYCRPGGRVCIMGDAAHATTPHVGAGAGMAIEDAFILSGLLGCVQKNRSLQEAADSSSYKHKLGGEIPAVFQAYDAVRRPRSQRVVRESAENVARYCAISRAEGDELERLRVEAHQLGEWLWDFDLDESLAEAIRLMNNVLRDADREAPTARL